MVKIRDARPARIFANRGRALYNGLRMCKAMGRACARQWLAHVQSDGVRMGMVHVKRACARQLCARVQSNWQLAIHKE